MKAKEMGLTALALVLLAYWELMIGEIPLGLLSISYAEHQVSFCAVLTLKLLFASFLISRAILLHQGQHTQQKNLVKSSTSNYNHMNLK